MRIDAPAGTSARVNGFPSMEGGGRTDFASAWSDPSYTRIARCSDSTSSAGWRISQCAPLPTSARSESTVRVSRFPSAWHMLKTRYVCTAHLPCCALGAEDERRSDHEGDACEHADARQHDLDPRFCGLLFGAHR